mgnify:CR=1 FL=1|jgi:hypothetical protein
MTTKPETKFGREIMKNINAYLERFETYGKVGVPDLYGIHNGVVIWLELKCIKQNSINLSPFQISWNCNNFRHGGKNYYIVKDTRSKVLKLYDGNKGIELMEKGFKCPCSLELEPPTDWKRLEKYLFEQKGRI